MYLASSLSDKSFDLSKLLYKRMRALQLEITPLVMNYLLFNSAHFGKYKHMMQLLTEATILNIHIDMNTYIKMLSALYFDTEV